MKAVAYTRVSSAEQLREGFSIAAQRQLLLDYAERNKITIVAEFSDDETAKAAGRADFLRMLQHLAEHPDHAILVEKLDRLYRNEDDYFTLKKMGVPIHFVREGTVIAESATSHEKLMQRIKLAIAQNYTDNLSEEVKKGMRRKCEEGGWPTWAPLGYLNVKDARGRAVLAVDPVKAQLVAELFEAAATGSYSLADLVRLADRIGLRGRRGQTITKPTLDYIIKNEAYTGWFEWGKPKRRYQGTYEALITRDLFDLAQEAMKEGSRPKTYVHDFMYTGLLHCGLCRREDGRARLLTGDKKKGKYVYYFCAKCRRLYSEMFFDHEVAKQFNALQIDREISEAIVEEMTGWFDAQAHNESGRAGWIRKRLSELARLEAASYEEKLLGKVPEATWRDLSCRWSAEGGVLRQELAAIAPAVGREEFVRRVTEPFELAQKASAQFLSSKPIEKGKLLRNCCSNLIVTEGSVAISMRSPFEMLMKIAGCPDWLTNLDNLRTLGTWALRKAA